ncbi:DegQ family serine endoprotease [Luteimonas aestuarii]|uniref:Probable periplasmic serine endoprotease DegP-like n=1 Tax=Luteimonas aestuarii TaxID=453837 RepID=A0A4R5TXW7_9GAMM|nr:DegQ family serine endoprotease [Luteimonas aestuarii]
MKTALPAAVLVLATAAATAAVILPAATAQTEAVQAAPALTEPAIRAQAPAAPLVTGLPDFTRLVEQVGPAVVNIETVIGARTAQRSQPPMDDEQIPEIFRRILGPGFQMPGPGQSPGAPRGRSLGSGFLISADGYVLTNHHVIDGADEVKVTLTDRREFTAKVVGSDQPSDVAVLKIEATGLPVLRTGNAAQVRPGQWAVAIGSPFGFDQSVTAGIVSAVGRANPYADQRYVPFIQTDVAINRGNSGGPLLNTSGEVIGINSQIFSNSGGFMGVSFAIPIDVAMNVVEQIRTTGEVRRGQIGVQVGAITSEFATGLGLPDTRGALVSSVLPGGPAQLAGIEPGDVIRSVDGVAINQSSDLPPLIGAKAPGTRVRLGVIREGRERNIDVTLSQLEEATAAGPRQQGRPASPGEPAASNVLGIVGQEIEAAQRRQLGLEAGEGVRIARVDGAAARSAGLSPGDVILRVGRTAVGSVAALDRALRDVRQGQTVMLLVRDRTGNQQFVAVTPRDGE